MAPHLDDTRGIFIVHHDDDLAHATALKQAITAIGGSAFLAALDLRPGDVIDERITGALDAAHVVAVLVTDRWLDRANYYAREQVDRAIDRRIEQRAGRVIPLHLGEVSAKAAPYGVKRLHPLTVAPGDWSTAARELVSQCPLPRAAPPLTGPAQRRELGLVHRRGALRLRGQELTVRLDRQGDSAVVTWFTGGQAIDVAPRRYPVGLLDGLLARDLFRAIFPPLGADEPDPEPVMRALKKGNSPLAYELRLRICLGDPRWSALPWGDLTHDGHRLVDALLPWTIELVDRVDPQGDVDLEPAPPIVILTTDALTDSGIRGALTMASARYQRDDGIVGASTLAELPRLLTGRRAAVLLTSALSSAQFAQLGGLVGSLPAEDRPAALCIVDPAAAPLPFALLDRIPAITRMPHLDAAKTWLTRVLLHGWDPVIAACGTTAPGETGRPAHPIATAYATWKTGRVRRDEPPPAALMLDRITQRNRVLDRLRLLLDPEGHHRVMVFVASGPPQNRVELLAEQLEAHVIHELPELHLQAGRPRLPREGTFRDAAADAFYAAALAESLRLDPRGGMPAIMRQLAAGHLPGSQRVVWLDWGAFGHADEHPPLKLGELRGWLRWHVTLADHARRADVRIAALITCQATNAAPIERVVDEAVLATDLPCVDFAALTPLKAVKRDELRQYLNTPQFSRAKPDQVGKLTRALDAAVPDGDFERLVTLLDRGLRVGWEDLLRDLTGPPEARPDDDEEIT